MLNKDNTQVQVAFYYR